MKKQYIVNKDMQELNVKGIRKLRGGDTLTHAMIDKLEAAYADKEKKISLLDAFVKNGSLQEKIAVEKEIKKPIDFGNEKEIKNKGK